MTSSSGAAPVHVKDWGGAGAPLLLAHGLAAHVHWWDAVAERLAGPFRTAGFDFRGHGESPRAPDGRYAAELWVEDIESARRALGWDRFVLVGHSMGARVSVEYARRHEARLRGLVLVDFLVEPPSARRRRAPAQPHYPDETSAASRFRLQPPGTALGAEQLLALGRRSVRPADAGWTWKFDWRALAVPYAPPAWEALAEIRVPTLVVRGTLSSIMSREELARAAAALPQGRGAEIAEAHHHVPLDRPAELADAVARFASSLPA